MPPKKKKGSKKSGKKKSGSKKENEITEEDLQLDEPELNREFFIIHIADLERKLRLYKEKAEKLQTVNDAFLKKQKELSQEKHDLISFLETNLLNRGDEYSDLKDRFFGLQQAKEAEKSQYESTLQDIRSRLQESKDQLTAENSLISAKLAALDEFKIQKEKYLEEYAQLEEILNNKKEEHKLMLEAIQKKSENDHDRLKKEIVSRINIVAAEFRRISQKQTSETTKRTIRENVSIRTQLSKMDDKNLELIQENEEMRQKVKASVLRIRELEQNNNELAGKNLSHSKLLHLLTIKHQEHQEILQTYQNETLIIQSIEKENEEIQSKLENKCVDIEEVKKNTDLLKDQISSLNNELDEIKLKTKEARTALIEAVHHLQELLQYIPSTTSSGSAKSTHTSMSKRSQSRASSCHFTDEDIKEWGDIRQRKVAEEKLQQLLDVLDYEETSSRASSVNEIKRKSELSQKSEPRNSPSISIGSKNASLIRRLSPVMKNETHRQSRSHVKVLTNHEIQTQAKLQAIQQKKGFCVPGVLQMVPHMYRYIPTNREKTVDLNKKLNGLNRYLCEDDVEKPIKTDLLQQSNEERMKMWTNKLSS